MEICENAGKILLYELNSEDFWSRVEQMLADQPANNSINTDAFGLTDKLEWSVNVRPKKMNFDLMSSPIFLQYFFGGDRFG